ncbi:MAG: alanine racemase [Micrococcales bacterium]|nr:alanine racemase [Micrococcales bacterium]
MPVTLHIDRTVWRAHLAAVMAASPGLIPVAKGNGYGQGVARLAAVAQELDADTLAVGTLAEAALARPFFTRDILVLTPFHPQTDDGDPSQRSEVITTISSLDALKAWDDDGPFVLELATPLTRFGLATKDLAEAVGTRGNAAQALALHLPLDRQPGQNLAAASAVLTAAKEAGLRAAIVHVSHMGGEDCATLAGRFDCQVRARVGTDLWIGDGRALRVTGTVRAVHVLQAGQRVGYRQAKVGRGGHLVIVDGGTSHGVGLEAPRVGDGIGRALRGLAGDVLARSGTVRSGFTLDGRRLRYADSPHAQVAMLRVGDGQRVPKVGEELPILVRHTILNPDAVSEPE